MAEATLIGWFGLVGWGCGALVTGRNAWLSWRGGRSLMAFLLAATAVCSALMVVASVARLVGA